MYFSIHELRQVCSLELRLDPGTGMQCSKQFSLTFWIRNFAFSTLDCMAMAAWIFWRISEGGCAEDAFEKADRFDGAADEDDDVSEEEEEEGEPFDPPPKKPPKAIVMVRILGGF
jgi:hypothetical protein